MWYDLPPVVFSHSDHVGYIPERNGLNLNEEIVSMKTVETGKKKVMLLLNTVSNTHTIPLTSVLLAVEAGILERIYIYIYVYISKLDQVKPKLSVKVHP